MLTGPKKGEAVKFLTKQLKKRCAEPAAGSDDGPSAKALKKKVEDMFGSLADID